MEIKKSILNIGLTVCTLSFFACNASAQQAGGDERRQGPPDPSEIMEKLDKNEDGTLARSEVKGPLQKDFDKIDTDQDGFLSLKELQVAPKPERPSKDKGRGL